MDLSLPYCRFCLSNLEKVTEFVDIQQYSDLVDKIIQIFHFNPVEIDKNPSILCLECHSRVLSTAAFIENVQKNQKVIEESLERSENVFVKQDPELQMDVEYLEEAFETSSESFICHLCEENFSSKQFLKQHMDEEHLETSKKHQKVPEIDKYLICELCDAQNFPTFSQMSDHYQAKHGIRGYVRCCNKQFFTKKSVVNHNEVHLNPVDFMCKICQKLLPDKYTLRDHELRHNPDEAKKFECDHCHKKFHVQKDLADHINRLHRTKTEPEKRQNCKLCEKSFVSKYSLMTHNRRFHMDLEKPICETCGKECLSKADLTAHIKARHTKSVRHKCDICGIFVKYLQKHKQIHVESKLHLKCDICGLETTTHKYLRLHMKIHSGEKPYTCSTCNASFKRKNTFEDHMSIHNGIPRHFCNFCGRSFNNSGNKSRHIKRRHSQQMAEMKKKMKGIKEKGPSFGPRREVLKKIN
ncbi:zinc finger protein OZF-like [Culicoides brevitarsis]|uniref:zinc finger protein OZF-like n=1 Tax=Culicoides brevitarsis TaxID=469753 RepID=UPI00307B8781